MKKNKMNGLYKAAFILLLVCILLLVGSIIIAYALELTKTAAYIGAGGVIIAFVGIILALKSKKVKNDDKNAENNG